MKNIVNLNKEVANMNSIYSYEISKELREHLSPIFKADSNAFKGIDFGILLLKQLLRSYYSLPLERHLTFDGYSTEKWEDITSDPIIVDSANQIFNLILSKLLKYFNKYDYAYANLKEGDYVFVNQPSIFELIYLQVIGVHCSKYTNFSELRNSSEKFDFMILHEISDWEISVWGGIPLEKKDVFDYNLYDYLSHNIKPNGEIFAQFDIRFLIEDYKNRESEKYKQRAKLINSHCIKYIISDFDNYHFPDLYNDRFHNVLCLSHKQNDSILFSSRMGDSRKEKTIKYDKLNGTLLFAPYYTQDKPELKEGEKIYKLSELVEDITPSVSEVSGDFIEYGFTNDFSKITVNDTNIEYRSNKEGFILPTNALIVNRKEIVPEEHYTLCFSYIPEHSEFDHIYAEKGNKVWRLKQPNLVSYDYLVYTLSSESFRHNNSLSYFSSFLSTNPIPNDDVIIVLPPKEEQESILKEIFQKKTKEADKQIEKSFSDYRKDVHMKKHAIGQTFSSLRNWVDFLLLMNKRGNGIIKDEDTIGKSNPKKAEEIYKNITDCISQIKKQVRTFTSENTLRKETDYYNLTYFIEDYVHKHQNALFKYQIDDECSRSSYLNSFIDTDSLINFPRKSLTQILDNIISNACSHGFENKDNNKKNIINIKLYIDEKNKTFKSGNAIPIVSVLEISNNGKPLLEGMTQEKVLSYGGTSDYGTHSGLGAYQVKNLMEQYSGLNTVEIINNPDSEFPVTYKLLFRTMTESI